MNDNSYIKWKFVKKKRIIFFYRGHVLDDSIRLPNSSTREREKKRTLSEKDKKRADNYCVHIVKDMYYNDDIIHRIRTICIVVLL